MTDLSDPKVELETYYNSLKSSGTLVIKGESDSLWIEHERFSALRFPEFLTSTPSTDELKRVFKNLNCLVINYTTISETPPLNTSFLYNCSDKNYTIDNLKSSSVRRNIRLAQRNLTCRFARWDEILEGGLQAFADTRTRVGLSDGNKKTFTERFKKFSLNPAHVAVGAFKGNIIAAFLSLIVVDDYVIIQGTFSMDEYKPQKPNNLLIDFVLNHYLTLGKYSVVCYGLSSVQEDPRDGLHSYKIQVGFDAIPVQRVFILHPLVKRFIFPIRSILRILLIFLPKNRVLRKAYGLLKISTC